MTTASCYHGPPQQRCLVMRNELGLDRPPELLLDVRPDSLGCEWVLNLLGLAERAGGRGSAWKWRMEEQPDWRFQITLGTLGLDRAPFGRGDGGLAAWTMAMNAIEAIASGT